MPHLGRRIKQKGMRGAKRIARLNFIGPSLGWLNVIRAVPKRAGSWPCVSSLGSRFDVARERTTGRPRDPDPACGARQAGGAWCT